MCRCVCEHCADVCRCVQVCVAVSWYMQVVAGVCTGLLQVCILVCMEVLQVVAVFADVCASV